MPRGDDGIECYQQQERGSDHLPRRRSATSRFIRVKRPNATGSSSGIFDVVRDTLAVVRRGHVAGIVIVSGLRTFVRGMWLATAVIASLRLLHAGSAGVGLLMLAGSWLS